MKNYVGVFHNHGRGKLGTLKMGTEIKSSSYEDDDFDAWDTDTFAME